MWHVYRWRDGYEVAHTPFIISTGLGGIGDQYWELMSSGTEEQMNALLPLFYESINRELINEIHTGETDESK
jgi:hypothetical protein